MGGCLAAGCVLRWLGGVAVQADPLQVAHCYLGALHSATDATAGFLPEGAVTDIELRFP